MFFIVYMCVCACACVCVILYIRTIQLVRIMEATCSRNDDKVPSQNFR